MTREGSPGLGSAQAVRRWTDERGQEVVLAQFRGAPVVLSAFFTSCTLRCPMTIEKLRALDGAFRRVAGPVPIVVLTLDPRNDTVERLARFKRSRDLPDNWHFIRGSPTDTRALAVQLGANPAYDDTHIDHDVAVVVLDAAGRSAVSLSGWSFDPDTVVRKLRIAESPPPLVER